MILVITICTFVCITLGALAAYWLMFRPPSAATEHLKQLGDGGGATIAAPSLVAEESAVSAFAEKMATPLSRIAPPSAAEAKKPAKHLMHAGYRSPNARIIYRALQLLSMAFFPGAVALGCALWGKPLGSAAMWILGGFVPAFLSPASLLGG